MMGLTVLSSLATPVVAVFGDVGGYLTGPEFLTVLANLISSVLFGLVGGLLNGLFGVGGA